MDYRKRSSSILFLLLAFSVVILCLALLYTWLPPASADFTGFKTDQYLNGSRLQSSKIVRVKEPGLDIWRFDYIQKYESGVSLYQRKVGDFANPGECSNNAGGGYTVTCVEGEFKEGSKYAVVVTLYKNVVSSMDVSALIGETEFYFGIPKEQMKSMATYNGWQQFFNGMERIDLKGMPFEIRDSVADKI